ncbi:MAG: HD-GYP domain-containing protein [Treponema sp.]|nr:HD-GYP domain-containing protein [Treponema sp.]
MKKVAVKDIKEGTVFSDPVYIEGNNLFVPAGSAVRKKDLARLNSWGIETVETDGHPIIAFSEAAKTPAPTPAASPPPPKAPAVEKKPPPPKPGPAPEAPSVVSLPEIHENKGAYRSYLDIIERLEAICTSIADGASVEARSIDTITSRILQAVRDQRHSFIGYILGGEIKGYKAAKSLVNSAILSALIAQELKLPNHKVLQIVTGALLHDVGMLRIPKEIVEKRGGLSTAELQRIQSHPLYTYKIVVKELLYPEDVGLIVLQHHERWDGEGYPRQLSGKTIDIGARIVSVADAFEAMVSQKPYRNSMMGYQAMKNLLSDNLRRFDPDVIKAFIQTMGIYPIGSIILLNNGSLARVVNVQGNAPLRPKIRILIDEFGTVFKQDEGEEIDLLVEKSLFIAKAIDPKEAARKYA